MQRCTLHAQSQEPLVSVALIPSLFSLKPLAGTNATTAQTVQLAKTPLGEPFFVIMVVVGKPVAL